MRFSIVSVAKNDLEGLRNTYTSILSQDFHDFEWIVIDGNSGDGTREWLKNLPAGSVKWISEPDESLYQAMNKGLRMSSGEYLIFMNSADRFAASDVLQKVAGAIDAATERLAFIYGDSIDGTPSGERFYKKTKPFRSIWKGMFTSHQAMFFEKAGLNGMTFDERFKWCADYKFICQYLVLLRDAGKETSTIQLAFPICNFLLGGLNEKRRFQSLFEDYAIRRDILKQNIIVAMSLFILHYIHYLLKRTVPNLMRKLRYDRNPPSLSAD